MTENGNSSQRTFARGRRASRSRIASGNFHFSLDCKSKMFILHQCVDVLSKYVKLFERAARSTW